jgi:hypothetical protein
MNLSIYPTNRLTDIVETRIVRLSLFGNSYFQSNWFTTKQGLRYIKDGLQTFHM